MDRPIELVLAEWREAERRLLSLAPDDPATLSAQTQVERLRLEYQTLTDSAGHIAEELARPPGLTASRGRRLRVVGSRDACQTGVG